MNEGRIWTRDNNVATFSKDGDIITIAHTGRQDWALSEGTRIPVEPGEVFELKTEATLEGTSHASISVITWDKDGETISWSYGSKEFVQAETLKPVSTRFAIPRGVATIEPRVIGYELATVHPTRRHHPQRT